MLRTLILALALVAVTAAPAPAAAPQLAAATKPKPAMTPKPKPVTRPTPAPTPAPVAAAPLFTQGYPDMGQINLALGLQAIPARGNVASFRALMDIGLAEMDTGFMSLGLEALYHMPAVYMLKGTADPSRWHFEVATRLGGVTGAAFYDMGPVYSGPGVRVGLPLF